jgi:ligand-binding sensor domain-containing protein/signal transduction histidine kinase
MRFLACLLVVVLMSAASAQVAPVPDDFLSGYTTQQWQTPDGLPEQTVQAFAETADGYLWIGTSGGLLRFDGARFTEYSHSTTAAFAENSIFCLMAGKDGTLWIGTEGGGLIRFSNGTFRRFSAADGVSDGFIRTVIEERNGQILIGTDNGLFQLANSRAERATRVDGTADLPAIAVHALMQDRDGNIWVGGSRLVRLGTQPGAKPQEYKLPGAYSENRVKSILQTRDGSMWVGTVSGLQQLQNGAANFVGVPGLRGTVRVLRETSDGTLWIGTIGHGAFTYRNGSLRKVAPHQPIPSGTVLAIHEDSLKNVWLGTEAGMVRLSRTPVTLTPLPDASDFETISADNDGALWVASTKLFHLVHGVPAIYTFPQLHGARVRNVFRDRSGRLWIGTDGSGLFHITAGTTEQYTTANGMTNNFVRAIMQARNGDMWIATDEGVSRIAHGAIRNFQVRDGLSYFSVRCIVEGIDGDIWIGTDRGLNHLHQDTFQHDIATEALGAEKVWAIHASSDGEMYFGTRNSGLYRFANGTIQHFTQDEGLAANSIYSILEDRQRHLWIGSPDGVSLIDRREFEQRRDYSKQHLSQRFYSRSDGGDIAPLYGGTQPAAVMTDNGDMWFPTNKGPVRIVDIGHREPLPSRMVIDQVIVDGRKTDPQGELKLPSGNANLEISYGPILLSTQAGLRFMYKLEGFDRDWVYASSRRVAYYTNLPARKYVFHVRVLGSDSAAALPEATLAIVKQPVFYRTAWFFALCVLAIAACVWGVHFARVRRIHTEFRAVLDERARLAREMHDTLIQGCASVSVLLEACSIGEVSTQIEQREVIDYARTQLAASIDEARQAVWNLRTERSDDLGIEVKKLAGRIARESSVDISCQVRGTTYPLKKSAMHELLMISREALYNAALHAAPSEVSVNVIYSAQDVVIEVRDNGCGFDQTQVAGGHYGLVGIGERVRQLGGTFQVTSVVTKGTEVSAVIPKSTIVASEMVAP